MQKIVLIGAGGHFKVIADILKENYDIIGVTDLDNSKIGKEAYGIRVLGNDEVLKNVYNNGIRLSIVALGSTRYGPLRKNVYNFAKDIGYKMVNAVSSTAILSGSVVMGEGNAVLDGAIVHADTRIGNNTIINTGAIIEHDCIVGDHVHVSPGAVIAGGVTVGECTHVGAGATVIQGIHLGKNCTIGAGSVVLRDVPDNSTVVGIPARVIR